MGKKRKNEDKNEIIRRKIKRLENKLRKRIRVISSDEESIESSPNNLESIEEVIPESSPHHKESLEEEACMNEAVPHTSSSAQNPVPSTSDLTNEVQRDSDIDVEILSLLGEVPQSQDILGDEINKNISDRWQLILTKGLIKETKQSLLQEYRVPKNCEMLLTPILNPEVKAGISELTSKKDFSLMLSQKQISTALAALAQTTEKVITKKYSSQDILKPLSDASKLLCDSFYYLTKARRNLVINTINAELKDTLRQTTRDTFLFGTDLPEKLRSAKTIQKTGESLKPSQPSISNRNNQYYRITSQNRLNWKPPQRKPAARPEAGRPRPVQRSGPPPPPPPPPRHTPNYTRSRSPPKKYNRRY